VAVAALVSTAVLAFIVYGISYRFFFLRSAEAVEGPASAFRLPVWLQTPSRRMLGRLLRCSVDRACLGFIFRTLTRSERHTAMLAATLGLGLALAVQSAAGARAGNPVPIGILASPLIVIYSIATGLRLSFGLPAELRANWVFRVSPGDSANPALVVKLAMLLFLIPVVLISAIACGYAFGFLTAAWHTVFVLTVSLIFTEGLTSEFRVIPFTCSWIPGRQNMVFALAVWLTGLGIFGQGLALLEAVLLLDPWRFCPFILTAAGIIYGIRSLHETKEPLVWTDTRGELDLLRITE